MLHQQKKTPRISPETNIPKVHQQVSSVPNGQSHMGKKPFPKKVGFLTGLNWAIYLLPWFFVGIPMREPWVPRFQRLHCENDISGPYYAALGIMSLGTWNFFPRLGGTTGPLVWCLFFWRGRDLQWKVCRILINGIPPTCQGCFQVKCDDLVSKMMAELQQHLLEDVRGLLVAAARASSPTQL